MHRQHQQGLSLVELMVGMAIGLILMAVAIVMLTHHLRETRSLLLEASLMQDLRAAADVIARDLRRAGHWHDAAEGVWHEGAPSVASNPNAEVTIGGINRIAYSREAKDSDESIAYRLRQGVIEMKLGEGTWQAMTDVNTMSVSSLAITPSTQEMALSDFCSRACSEGNTRCPPRQQIRRMALQIQARSTSDARITRSVQTEVRLRNDALIGACQT